MANLSPDLSNVSLEWHWHENYSKPGKKRRVGDGGGSAAVATAAAVGSEVQNKAR